MKTKLVLAALLASGAISQAGPPISPAKTKAPLHLSQIKGIFHKSEPVAPAAPASQAAAGSTASGASTAAPTATVPAAPIKPRAKARTFLNHPITAPGPH